MHHRILDFSLNGLKLRVQQKQLKIIVDETRTESIPLADIAVMILSHPQITLSYAVLQELNEAGAVAVICNKKSLPIGLCYPLVGHHLQTNRMQLQGAAPKPLLKKLWRQVVRKKIQFQGELLEKFFQDDAGLKQMITTVRSGDPNNREGIAAKKYWAKLFGENGFRRLYNGEDRINIALNYGYAVLRAVIARAISAAGLHPSLGLFHHNRYDPYCLANDLMEPFRPVVDAAVYCLDKEEKLSEELSPTIKNAIIGQLTKRYIVDKRQETLFETAAKMTESLSRIYENEEGKLLLPTTLPIKELPL